jgi:hypothetical protein
MLHKEILTEEQIKLLPLIKKFSKNFYLVGGTAIALHIGHRRSIDFDLFSSYEIKPKQFLERIKKTRLKIDKVYSKTNTELTLIVNSVKLTFYNFPYDVPSPLIFERIINLPDLLDLAAMKVFALGGRGKWKDYVDLYILLTKYFSLDTVCERASQIFENSFNSRLLREQISYFDDIDYSENVKWLIEPVPTDVIKKELIKIATSS